jgi:hypothetical protein
VLCLTDHFYPVFTLLLGPKMVKCVYLITTQRQDFEKQIGINKDRLLFCFVSAVYFVFANITLEGK